MQHFALRRCQKIFNLNCSREEEAIFSNIFPPRRRAKVLRKIWNFSPSAKNSAQSNARLTKTIVDDWTNAKATTRRPESDFQCRKWIMLNPFSRFQRKPWILPILLAKLPFLNQLQSQSQSLAWIFNGERLRVSIKFVSATSLSMSSSCFWRIWRQLTYFAEFWTQTEGEFARLNKKQMGKNIIRREEFLVSTFESKLPSGEMSTRAKCKATLKVKAAALAAVEFKLTSNL